MLSRLRAVRTSGFGVDDQHSSKKNVGVEEASLPDSPFSAQSGDTFGEVRVRVNPEITIP